MADSMLGKSLPQVTLESSQGGKVKLPDDLRGKFALIYFYPKDDTPGCTAQACSYRDSIADFEKLGCKVIGVSADDLGSHGAFVSKYSLNFPLLADTQHLLSEALGVWGEQEWNGQKFKGLSRDTFLVDPQGKIVQVWRKVSAKTTMQETYESVRKLVAH